MAGVRTIGVTNVEAGASTEIKVVVRTRYLKQLTGKSLNLLILSRDKKDQQRTD